MTNLESLALSHNIITDISVVVGLTNLESLALSHNIITDISALAGLANLKDLELGGNAISDVSAVTGLTNLTFLYLSHNIITDISALVGLTNLEWLLLENNAITDLSPLVANTGLGSRDYIYVDRNPLDSVSINTHIPVLESRGVEVFASNLKPPRGESVTPDEERVVDIPDPNLRAAIESALGIAPGGTITAGQMARLTELVAVFSDVSNLAGLEYATDLTYLILSGNTITDISAVAGLTNLESLYLKGNAITDISALAGLTNLTILNLGYNAIKNLSPLVANTGLEEGDWIDVSGNPLNSESIDTHIPALQEKGVKALW